MAHCIIWDESLALLIPTHPKVEERLTFKERNMIPDFTKASGFRVEIKTQKAFSLLQKDPRLVALQTHAGFLDIIIEVLDAIGVEYTTHDTRPEFPEARLDLMHGFRFNQKELLTAALVQNKSGMIGAPTRFGKCFGKGTPILMSDGNIKNVEDISVGDLVMGPDSKPKEVVSTHYGRDEMYKIVPNRGGMSWTCNGEHILHLERTKEKSSKKWDRSGERENISVKDYLTKSKWYKHTRKLVNTCIEFPYKKLHMDPYVYGYWLGDGTSNKTHFTTEDSEVEAYLDKWASQHHLEQSEHVAVKGEAKTLMYINYKGRGKGCPQGNFYSEWFKKNHKCGGINAKFLRSSRRQRLQLLAGLIDSDGHAEGGLNYSITSKYEKLANDILYLAQSLGFPGSVIPVEKTCVNNGVRKTYYLVALRGNLTDIPVKVPRKVLKRKNKFSAHRIGFTIESVGVSDFYGFQIASQDGLFLLGDFTIVHNSYLMLNILRAYPGVCSAVIAPGADLLTQSFKFLKQMLPHRDVRQLGGGSGRTYGSEDLTVCSMDSMHRLEHGRIKFVIVDEPHALVTENRYENFLPLMHARKISLGATLDGRFDGRDILMTGLLGSVLSKVTFKQACDLGAICPIMVIGIRYRLPYKKVKTKAQARKRFFFENEEVRDIIAYISNEIVPAKWQTLTFIANESQGEYLRDTIKGQTLIMAKRCTKIVRSIYNGMMQAATVTRALATKMYSQGVTFNHVRVMINAEPGGATISAVQKAGRLAEVRPNKKCGVVFEIFFDTPAHLNMENINSGQYMWTSLVRESRAKMAMYRDLGYSVHVVESVEEAKELFNEKAL